MMIAVPNQELESRKEAIFSRLRDQVALPGFRKGQVPKSILEKRFGPQATAEGLDEILRDAIQEAFQKEKILPVEAPKVSDVQMDNGQIRFKVRVEVRPELKLTDEQILRLPLPKPDGLGVTDEDVAAAVENERKTTATFQPDLEIRPVRHGDFVVADYEGFLKEKDTAIAGGKSEGAMIEIGAGRFLPGFDEQIIGMSPGDKKRIEIAFPPDFYDEDLRGKPAYFHVAVQTIKKRLIPDLTDEWAKEHGHENLADMRMKIRAEMERGTKEMSKEELRRSLFTTLDQKIVFDPPKSFVERQARDLMQNLEKQYKGGRKELLDRLAKEGKGEADLEADVQERARRQVKNSLILDAVAKTKNIQVSDEDMQARLKLIAEQQQVTADAIRRDLEKQDRIEEFKYAILDEKVVQFLLDHADIR